MHVPTDQATLEVAGTSPTALIDDADEAVHDEAVMLAATALGLSITSRAGAAGILCHLADRQPAALAAARVRLGEVSDVDAAAVDRARLLLSAAAERALLAG